MAVPIGVRTLTDDLGIVAIKFSTRRFLLVNCGICRSMARLFLDKQARRALAVLEESADKPLSLAEQREALNWAHSSLVLSARKPGVEAAYFMRCAVHNLLIPEPGRSRNESGNFIRALEESGDQQSELWARVAAVIQDVAGNSSRPIVADSAWLTSDVVALASAIYQDRAFDRLPILADALEEAGCTNADILLHCRQPGEHVRGCWTIDLLLGKS